MGFDSRVGALFFREIRECLILHGDVLTQGGRVFEARQLFGFSLREGFLIKKRSAVVLLVALGVVAC
jgi:hypothetical protein